MNYFEDWTVEDVAKHNARINRNVVKNDLNIVNDKLPKKDKKSKYRAVKTNIDGHTFDSKKEADFYSELKLRLQSREIRGFCLQPIFILAPGLKYKADFIVFNNDETADIIDVKGFKTDVYKNKKKVFEDKYKLKIKEV